MWHGSFARSARRLHGVRIVLKNKFSSDCGARVDLRPFIRAVATAALASQWGGLLYAGGAPRSSALDSIYGWSGQCNNHFVAECLFPLSLDDKLIFLSARVEERVALEKNKLREKKKSWTCPILCIVNATHQFQESLYGHHSGAKRTSPNYYQPHLFSEFPLVEGTALRPPIQISYLQTYVLALQLSFTFGEKISIRISKKHVILVIPKRIEWQPLFWGVNASTHSSKGFLFLRDIFCCGNKMRFKVIFKKCSSYSIQLLPYLTQFS